MSKKTKHIYVHETHTLSQSNGELYISGENFEIVWNTESLFLDLPHIIRMVLEAREETNNRISEQLREELTRLSSI
jgi:hypothetical protein